MYPAQEIFIFSGKQFVDVRGGCCYPRKWIIFSFPSYFDWIGRDVTKVNRGQGYLYPLCISSNPGSDVNH